MKTVVCKQDMTEVCAHICRMAVVFVFRFISAYESNFLTGSAF